jgi:hypothetical protein
MKRVIMYTFKRPKLGTSERGLKIIGLEEVSAKSVELSDKMHHPPDTVRQDIH